MTSSIEFPWMEIIEDVLYDLDRNLVRCGKSRRGDKIQRTTPHSTGKSQGLLGTDVQERQQQYSQCSELAAPVLPHVQGDVRDTTTSACVNAAQCSSQSILDGRHQPLGGCASSKQNICHVTCDTLAWDGFQQFLFKEIRLAKHRE